MLPFALTSFLAAFLLFSVQPLMGRYLLPWFGGSSSVWSGCLVFFQTALLVGYTYAHWLSKVIAPQRQFIVHGALLTAAFLFLPPIPELSESSGASFSTPWQVLGLLTTTIGIPFALLSASGPLIQHWFSHTYPQRSPYRLFALSNAGSLFGLLSYPFLVELFFGRATQAQFWGVGFLIVTIALIWCAFSSRNHTPVVAEATASVQRPVRFQSFSWLGWSALGSSLLVTTTAALTHDVAGFPLLWIAPLTVYLITFIIAFDHARWYHRPTFSVLLIIAAIVALDAAHSTGHASFWQLGAAYLFGLFVAGQICHGELHRERPAPDQLTSFYLHIAAGGAIGSMVVTLAAPLIFDSFFELPLLWSIIVAAFCFRVWRERNVRLMPWIGLGLLFSPFIVPLFRSADGFIIGSSLWRDYTAALMPTLSLTRLLSATATAVLVGFCLASFNRRTPRQWNNRLTLLAMFVPCACATAWIKYGIIRDPAAVHTSRNYHGRITVSDYNRSEPRAYSRYLSHGSTTHGIQLMHPDFQRWPTTYYGPASGVGLIFAELETTRAPLRVGIVGLGVGTIAGYGQTGDLFRFYELDSAIARIAQSQFTALKHSLASTEIKLGDGRRLLANESHSGEEPRFDILIIDAFSSDSIPVHLLTSDAFEIYLRRLTPDGILILNVSNRLVDVRGQVLAQSHRFKLTAATIYHQPPPKDWWAFASEWVLLSRDPNRLNTPAILAAANGPVGIPTDTYQTAWSDDFASLWSALR